MIFSLKRTLAMITFYHTDEKGNKITVFPSNTVLVYIINTSTSVGTKYQFWKINEKLSH